MAASRRQQEQVENWSARGYELDLSTRRFALAWALANVNTPKSNSLSGTWTQTTAPTSQYATLTCAWPERRTWPARHTWHNAWYSITTNNDVTSSNTMPRANQPLEYIV
ncbi:MAG: hypothetical protein WC505_07705 [Patescibacteria group bacterium]